MAITQELTAHIQQSLKAGMNKETIRKELQQAGWQTKDINDAFTLATSGIPSSDAGNKQQADFQDNRIYPVINTTRIENPNRLLAFPILGPIVKVVILIPIFIWMWILSIAWLILSSINGLSVLFTGSYMRSAYDFYIGINRLQLKTTYFMFGLTNAYPGFSFEIHDNYSMEMPFPEHPNRLLAVPVLGILVRSIILIPLYIWQYAIILAGSFGFFIIGWIPILFTGKYPDSIFELVRDATRMQIAVSLYLGGVSDIYPSFTVSLHHKGKQIVLIILAILYMLSTLMRPIFFPTSQISSYRLPTTTHPSY